MLLTVEPTGLIHAPPGFICVGERGWITYMMTPRATARTVTIPNVANKRCRLLNEVEVGMYRAFQCEQDKGCVCLVPIVQWYIRSLLACSLRIFVTNLFVHAHSVICSSCSGGDCSFYLCLYPLYGHIQVIRSFGPVLEQILQSCHEAATEFPRMLLPLKICVQVSFIPVTCSSHKLFSAPS